jgi:hypothetical protein
LGELQRLEPNVILRETFTLPLQAALLQARKNYRRTSGPRYVTIVENWCQLPDGQVHDAGASDGGLGSICASAG